MISLIKIENAVRAQNSNWKTFFRRHGVGFQCILFPKRVLTEYEYQTLLRRFSRSQAKVSLTPEERKRNSIRALAHKADEDARY
jgi:hypothetical protein